MVYLEFVVKVLIASWLISRGATSDQNWVLVISGLIYWFFLLFNTERKYQIGYTFSIWYVVALFSLDWVGVLGVDARLALSFVAASAWALAIWIWQLLNSFALHPGNRALILASLAVALEWLLSYQPFGGFNWLRIAYIWSDAPISKISYWLGIPALTFIAIFVSSYIASPNIRLTRKLTISAVFVILIPTLNVLHSNAIENADEQFKVAVIQGGVPEVGLDFNAQRNAVFQNHLVQTEKFLDQGITVDLILWPENSVDIDPFLNPEIESAILKLSTRSSTPVLFGAVLRQGEGLANSAVLANEGKIEEVYQKRKLVPFGEYLPFRNLLAPLITRFDRLSTDFYAGDFVGSVSVRKQRLGILICYEVAFDQLWQSYAESADYLLILTNNATYGGTKQPWQQLNITRLQAISIGKPVVVASTSGISAIIDSSGEIQQIVSKNESGTLLADLPRALNIAPSNVMTRNVNYFALGILLSNLIYFSIRNVARRKISQVAHRP